MAKSKKKLTKVGRRVFQVILGVSIIVAGVSIFQIANGLYQYRKGSDTYTTLVSEQAYTVTTTTNPETGEEEETERVVNFEALAQINSDITGWLTMEDSVIDYPIVQTTDNEYYLTHLFNREVNNMGCIFVDYRNTPNFQDTNTAMYAHHMRNGSMFADLEKYESQDYYNTHQTMTLKTPTGDYLVEPFAGLVLSGEWDFVVMNFDTDTAYFDYVNNYIGQSTFTSNVTLNAQDKFITMITCSYDYDNARYALFAKITPITY